MAPTGRMCRLCAVVIEALGSPVSGDRTTGEASGSGEAVWGGALSLSALLGT